jgi:hypothetical protein
MRTEHGYINCLSDDNVHPFGIRAKNTTTV